MKYHTRRHWLENIKPLTILFGNFRKSHAELPRFFMALEQSNLGCVVTWETFDGHMYNIEVFQRVFWVFHPSIEGFNHYQPILSIDGTHMYGKYKRTLMNVMGCCNTPNYTIVVYYMFRV